LVVGCQSEPVEDQERRNLKQFAFYISHFTFHKKKNLYICGVKKKRVMETTFVLQKEELTIGFLEGLKKMFKNSNRLQISVSNSEDFDLYKKETKEDYFNRLEKAIESVEKNKISFTEKEFEAFIKDNE
jgi:uncharacterized Fe-S cluster-containing radical SAM superfamily protein